MARSALVLALALGWPLLAVAAEPISRPGSTRSQTGLVLRGNDSFVGGEAERRAPMPGGPVSLDLVEVPLPVAAKAVLADALGWGYSVNGQASGAITLQTGGPVGRDTLLAMFESALSSRGLALRRHGRTVEIAPAGGPDVRAVRGAGAESGAMVVPLRWISAAEMQSILGTVAPRDVVLRADRARNLLILSGDAGQIQALRQTIAVFDVDWMRGMSTAMVPVRSSSPAALARDLTQIFGGETLGTSDVIRFLPNEALNAILIVSSRATYLDRARILLEQLEGVAAESERQLFVYRIQNRSAKELAAVLQGVVAAEMGGTYGLSAGGYGGGIGTGGYGSPGGVGGYGPGGLGSGGLGGGGLGSGGLGSGSVGSGGLGASGGPLGSQAGSGAGAFGSAGFGAGGAGVGGMGASGLGGAGGYGSIALGGGPFGSGYGSAADPTYGMAANGPNGLRRDAIGIVADDANNSLVISATRNQYDKILRILGRLDAMPTQVLLETVIAEVTLNDNLQFGVQWFLKQNGDRLNLASTTTDGAAKAAGAGGVGGLITAAARGVPGFNYLLNATDFNVVLNALQGVTRINVISSPNITVLDNRTAKLQIGDQVPIVKQSGQSALSANAPILNEIELKDTGVILSVTPRVNKNGLVVLDINQEVSDVVPTTTSSINSPTIRQRRVATSVAVRDGHSLAIGGMVQEKAQITNETVPVLGDLPLIGPAFRNRVDGRVRTELLVFIRPRVIRGTVEADRIAEDFRQQLRTMMPVRPVAAPPPLPAAYPGSEGILRRMVD